MDQSPSRLAEALKDRYRLERELGHGGMATVYLAEDLKHDRKVAIKVLRPELAAVIGAERFLREIKTIATLQHPHILGLIDSGEVQGTAYYVMPFVEGESLRDRLVREKQLPIAEAVRLATEVATALDYAHRHGVIHRDIKPENVMLHDGSALVADFGIALAVSSAGGGSRMTETGMSLGTPHYMSPEQAMGQREITARSDVYALGAMTYEMLIGDPPFIGSTAQAIVAKVMTEKPVSLQRQRERVPDAVEDAVLTALEKLPADRFATAVEFAAALRGDLPAATRPGRLAARSRTGRPWRRRVGLAATGMALLAAGFLGGAWAMRRVRAPAPTFAQKTYRDEAVFNARFAPDGKTIVYSAASAGPAPSLFVIRPEYLEPTPLGLTGTHLLSVSSKGELAVLVRAEFLRHRLYQGTLARVPLGGGAPREVIDSVREADWSPDGVDLAIIHDVDGRDRLEFPVGTVIYQASGYLSDPRVSPDGKHVAFADHPFRWDDRGTVKIVDRTGKLTAVSRDFVAIEGMAWRPGSEEVWFSAVDQLFTVHGLDLRGHLRIVMSGSGNLTTQDVSSSGQLLLTRDDLPFRLMLRGPDAKRELDVSWLDVSLSPKLSHDGSLLAFSDGGEDGGPNYTVMLRKTAGGQIARLGEGVPAGFAPDDKWVLVSVPSTPPRVVLYPTGTGAERRVDVGPFESIGSLDWFPDGRSVLVCGNHTGEPSRCFAAPLAGGAARPVTPPGTVAGFVSADGREIVAFGEALGHRRYPLTGGEGTRIPGLTSRDYVIRPSTDGRALFLYSVTSPAVDRFELATSRREPFLTFGIDRDRFTRIGFATMADDPRIYAYVAEPYVSQLYTVDGTR